MDYIVSIKDAKKSFTNFPNTRGYPTFVKIRAIRHCFETGLRLIRHPDKKVMGWAGLATDPALYGLIDPKPWVMPVDPGAIAVFDTLDSQAEMKMKLAIFTREKNMFTSCENISSAMVRLLMANIEEKYQISNVSGLQGWNNNMTVMEILTQLEEKYGAPDPDAVAAMEAMFNKPHNPNDSPEVLYATLEECQKVAMMNKNPWNEKQVMMKAVELFRRSGIFKDKVFEEWKDAPTQTYVNMKDHFHKAYMKRLESIQSRMTSGRGGYSNANPFSALNMTAGSDTESTSGDTVDTIVAAAMASTDAKMDNQLAAATIPTVCQHDDEPSQCTTYHAANGHATSVHSTRVQPTTDTGPYASAGTVQCPTTDAVRRAKADPATTVASPTRQQSQCTHAVWRVQLWRKSSYFSGPR